MYQTKMHYAKNKKWLCAADSKINNVKMKT